MSREQALPAVSVDMDGFWKISEGSRKRVLDLSEAEERISIKKALAPFNDVTNFSRLDLSYRAINAKLLEDIKKAKTLRASHARFPPYVGSLGSSGPSWSIVAMDLTGCSMTTTTLHEILKACSNLKYLILDGVRTDEQLFMFEKPLANLKVLSLYNAAGMSDSNVVRSLVKAVPNIQNLDVTNTDLTTEGVLALVSGINPKLEILALADLGWRVDLKRTYMINGRI